MEKLNIYQAISACMADIGAIGKDKKNTQQGFMYRGIDDVMNALNPAMVKNGLFVVPEVLEQSREERTTKNGSQMTCTIMKIKYTFYAQDGTFISAVTVGEAMDMADKSSNKAMAIAFKYACFQVFCIPTEEMQDPDSVTPEPIAPKQQAKAQTKAQTKAEPKKETEEQRIIKGLTLINSECQKRGIDADGLTTICNNLFKKSIDKLNHAELVSLYNEVKKIGG